jgi:hypothetical protein
MSTTSEAAKAESGRSGSTSTWLMPPGMGQIVLLILGIAALGVAVAAIVVGQYSPGTSTTSVMSGSLPGTGTQTESAGSTSVTTASTSTVPSDSVLTALVVIGAVAILAAIFYSRITKIVLPGGGEIDLSATEVEKQNDLIAQRVSAVAGDANPAPDFVAAATTSVHRRLRTLKEQRNGAPLADADIEAAVDDLVRAPATR